MEHSVNLLQRMALCRVNQTVTTVAQLSDFFSPGVLFRAQMQYSRYNYTILITHTQEP